MPVAEIDTLANIMSSCVNSGGGTAGQANACGSLFSLTTPSGGAAPSTTFKALLNVAKDPSLNTPSLFRLQPKESPFEPVLSAAPADFSVGFGSFGATSISRAPIPTITQIVAFSATSNCPASLAPTMSCSISVSYSPPDAGPFSGSVVVTTNAATSPDTITLSGTTD